MEGQCVVEWIAKEGEHWRDGEPKGRQGSGLAVVDGGVLWLFGGRMEASVGRVYGNDLWYRPVGEGQLWTQVVQQRGQSWPCERHNLSLVACGGDTKDLLLFGGARHGKETAPKHYEQVYCNDLWRFSTESMTWTEVVQPPSSSSSSLSWPFGRHCHTLTDIGHGRFALFGGYGNDAYQNDVWILEREGKTGWRWTHIKALGTGPSRRSQHASCYHAGKLYIFGGYFWENRKEVYFNDLFSLSLGDGGETPRWTKHEFCVGVAAVAPSPRNRSCMFVLENRVFLVNGNSYNNKRGTDKWYAEIWELLDNGGRWQLTTIEANHKQPQQSHMSHVVVNNECYFYGGEAKKRRYSTLHILRLSERKE